MKNENQKYEAPKLREHGSIEQITQGGTDGSNLDASFAAGTPRGSLTFS